MRALLHGRGIFALAAGVWLAAVSATAAQAQVLKVLQLNFNSEIVAFDDRDGYMRDLRFSALVDWIYQNNPDIVFIEEGWNYRDSPSVAIPLAEATGYDYFYRIGEGFPGFLWDSDVVLVKKKYKLEQTQKIELPHSAWHIGDEETWIVPFGSITNAVGGKITLDDGTPFFIYATHLLGGSSSDREDQLSALGQAIRDQAARNGVSPEQLHAIVAGDLNSTPTDDALFPLLGNGYVDTWAQAHPDHVFDDAGVTSLDDPYSPHYNPLSLGSGQLPAQNTLGGDARIDFILARGPGVTTLASTVMFTHPYNNFWMSDHYGLFSTINVGGGDPAPVPNPITDSDGMDHLGKATVLEISDRDFDPCSDQVDCSIDLPDQEVDSYRGFTLINRSSDRIVSQVEGPMRALPGGAPRLDSDQVASFAFIVPGEYRITIYDRDGDELHAKIHVSF